MPDTETFLKIFQTINFWNGPEQLGFFKKQLFLKWLSETLIRSNLLSIYSYLSLEYYLELVFYIVIILKCA